MINLNNLKLLLLYNEAEKNSWLCFNMVAFIVGHMFCAMMQINYQEFFIILIFHYISPRTNSLFD